MELEFEAAGSLCVAEVFRINGQEANVEDFGHAEFKHARNRYGCADMRFVPDKPREKVLAKYGISEDEYQEIADKLRRELSFGRCSLCE